MGFVVVVVQEQPLSTLHTNVIKLKVISHGLWSLAKLNESFYINNSLSLTVGKYSYFLSN